jgi:glycosyltransferase involved in cell wall biosynthesis
MKRKLLLITCHFPPSAASGTFRMLGFARHLPQFGWGTVVVAPPSMPWEPVDANLVKQIPPGTVIYHAPYPHGFLAKPIRVLTPWLAWLLRLRRAAVRAFREQGPDAVLTSGPPHCVHKVGYFIKRRYGIPWLADFRDPWISSNPAPVPATLRSRWEHRWEGAVFREADVVIGNVEGVCQGYRRAYPAHAHKVLPITNGYDPEVFPQPSLERDRDRPVSVVHTGALYDGRDPRPFLDALAGWKGRLPDEAGQLRVRFLGDTTPERGGIDLRAEIRGRNLDHCVACEGQVPYGAALQAVVDADILLLLDQPGRRMGVPAKVYEYLGAGRPILALAEADGDTARIIRHSSMPHRLATPTDSAAIGAALLDLVRQLRVNRRERPRAEQRFQFTRRHKAQQLAELLDRQLGTGHGVGLDGA